MLDGTMKVLTMTCLRLVKTIVRHWEFPSSLSNTIQRYDSGNFFQATAA